MQVLVVGGNNNINSKEIMDYILSQEEDLIIMPEERRIEDRKFPIDILEYMPEPIIKKSNSWDHRRKRKPWEGRT